MITSKYLARLKTLQTKATTKIQGTVVEKWATYWKTVANDYLQVATSVRDDIKRKPLKSSVVISGMAFLALCAKKNPDEKSFRHKFIECSNDLALVHPSLVREITAQHLKSIEKCYKSEVLRHTSFGLFSVIWIDTSAKSCDVYSNRCSYLQWRYLQFPNRVIDIGFLDVWWIISRNMLDYDVNYIE